MNWEQLKWWVNLVPRKQVVAGTAIVVMVLCTVVGTLFRIIISSKDETIENLMLRLEAKDNTISKKDDEITKCHMESLAREKDNLQVERERNRKADSMNYALMAAEAALKKVAKHGN